jgi:hypothetical protein
MENGYVTIAVIDDGINNCVIKNLQFDITINKKLDIKLNKLQTKEFYNHATICSAIIKKYAPWSLIGSIKILDGKSSKATSKQLIHALYWCVDNNVKIANVSIGSVNCSDFDDIRECVNEVSQKGMIIIAAVSNKDIFTVPACLSNVIGVKCEESFYEESYSYNTYALDGVDICASGRHGLTNLYGREVITKPANSFAAPLITAKVYDVIAKNINIGFESIKAILYKTACNFKGLYYNPHFYVSMDWVSNYQQIDLYQINCSAFENRLSSIQTLLIDLHSVNNNQYVNILKYLCEKIGKNLICISKDLNSEFNEIYLSNSIEGKIYDSKFYEKIVRQNTDDDFSDIPIPVLLLNSLNGDISIKISNLLKKEGYYSVIVTRMCLKT